MKKIRDRGMSNGIAAVAQFLSNSLLSSLLDEFVAYGFEDEISILGVAQEGCVSVEGIITDFEAYRSKCFPESGPMTGLQRSLLKGAFEALV